MSNLAKLEFPALAVSGDNYLSWALDARMHLQAQGLEDTIKEENQMSLQDKAKAMIFIRHHIHGSLKAQYLTVENPLVLWNNLKARFDHQREIFLPNAQYEWLNLRFQDYERVHDYNSELYRITSQLKLCGEPVTERAMIEKTLSTFHASHMTLQQQYRERGYTEFTKLIASLLVAEKNNELLMKNHQLRPTGSQAFPEANANTTSKKKGRDPHPHSNYKNSGKKKNKNKHHQKWNVYERGNQENKKYNNKEQICYRCGGKGHWSRTCTTEPHLVALYQASLKKAEANLVDDTDPVDLTHLDVSDFFEDPNGKISHLIGDGNVHLD